MSTPFADALSLCNLASVGIFGIVLSAAFCELEWTRQRKLLLAGCTVLMLALQGVVSLRWSTSFARYLYPVITHLPLVILLAAMTRKALWSLIAVLTAYLCCQLRRWAALLVIALFPTGGTALQDATELVVTLPLLLALVVALVIGALAQKSRMCFAGSIRDVILMKNFDLLSIIAALFAVMTIYNIATGNFHLSFSGQPIAHSQHLWNILGMYVVGFAAVLAGGCPLRQLILAGQGSSDSAVTFLGMLLGAAFAHNFNLVGSAAKAATATDAAVPGGPAMPGKIAVIVCIVLLFVIAATNLRRKKAAK
mgnify:FL=1